MSQTQYIVVDHRRLEPIVLNVAKTITQLNLSYVKEAFEASEFAHWLVRTEADEAAGDFFLNHQNNLFLVNLVDQPILKEATRIHALAHADASTRNRFLKACLDIEATQKQTSAHEGRNEQKRDISIICSILAQNFKFPSDYLVEDTDETFLWVFSQSDTRTTLAANAYMGVNVFLVASVLGQLVAQCRHAPQMASWLHASAGTMQCAGALLSRQERSIPHHTLVLWLIGTLQVFSDAAIWLDPQMRTRAAELAAYHTQQFTRELSHANLIQSELWDTTYTIPKPSFAQTYLLWGHYIVFTFVFMSRLSTHNIWRYIWVVLCTFPAVLFTLHEWHKDMMLLPPSQLLHHLQTLDKFTLQMTVAKDNTRLAVLHQSCNYFLMLAASLSNAAFYRPLCIADFFGGESADLEQNSKYADTLVKHRLLRVNREADAYFTAMYFQTHTFVRPKLTDQILFWMSQHVNTNSLVFKRLFSKLHASIMKSPLQEYSMHLLFDAFQYSVMAFIHYSQIQPFRGPDEVVYANVFWDAQRTGISNSDFLTALRRLDGKLTKLLLLFLNQKSNAVYTRKHLVNFDIVDDEAYTGFFNSKLPYPSSTFVTADVLCKTKIPPESMTYEEERRLFPKVRARAPNPPRMEPVRSYAYSEQTCSIDPSASQVSSGKNAKMTRKNYVEDDYSDDEDDSGDVSDDGGEPTSEGTMGTDVSGQKGTQDFNENKINEQLVELELEQLATEVDCDLWRQVQSSGRLYTSAMSAGAKFVGGVTLSNHVPEYVGWAIAGLSGFFISYGDVPDIVYETRRGPFKLPAHCEQRPSLDANDMEQAAAERRKREATLLGQATQYTQSAVRRMF